MPEQPTVHRKTSSRGAGDSKEATSGGAEAPGPREAKQLQETFPELTDPPHPQGEGSEGQSPASAAKQHGSGVHSGHKTSQPAATPYAEEKQCEAGPSGSQGEALQGPSSKLQTRKTQKEQ